jgi:hypothetical protein
MFVWDKPWSGAIKTMFLLSKQNNSQNFCFQPIIFEHFSVSIGVENILKFMASGHACLLVWDKKKDTFHIMLFVSIQQKVEHTGRQEASQLVVLY